MSDLKIILTGQSCNERPSGIDDCQPDAEYLVESVVPHKQSNSAKDDQVQDHRKVVPGSEASISHVDNEYLERTLDYKGEIEALPNTLKLRNYSGMCRIKDAGHYMRSTGQSFRWRWGSPAATGLPWHLAASAVLGA
jgi:hypothetical protein